MRMPWRFLTRFSALGARLYVVLWHRVDLSSQAPAVVLGPFTFRAVAAALMDVNSCRL